MSSSGFAFTRAERVALLARIVPALIAKDLDRLPPDRDGNAKTARRDFATAVHAARYIDSLEYVERDRLDYLEKKAAGKLPSEPGERG